MTPCRIMLFRPFRGFFPFSVFQSRRATYLRRFPTRRLCCAPRVSHPLDALLPSRPSGLVPSRFRSWGLTLRGLDPHLVPYVLSNAVPLRVTPQPKEEASLPGTHTPSEARRRVWVLARVPTPDASLGFPAPRFLVLSSEGRSHALSSPLALSRLSRRLTSPLAPQGFTLPRTQPLSLETDEPPCSLSPRYRSRRFGDLAGLGIWVSLRDRPASPLAGISSSPCCQVPGRSLPRILYR
jgi:hypothetical protein